MSNAASFTPGNLVTARGRDWIVLSGSNGEVLRLRPLSGSEDDQTVLHLALEPGPVKAATFPAPSETQVGGHDAAVLLRDALVLSLRRGAGPFRGFGQIAVQPRAYQLVPLLMALKLDPVRLLIADDVGVGKTIEAGLIARELLDRGDIDQMTVLCPPHLVEQWVSELEVHFNIRAVAVTAHSAKRLERDIPPGMSLFKAHPHTVVSLDYIKSKDRRDHFVHVCPPLVIVDEAHTCASTGRGRHQRHALLRELADTSTRHMVLLTATPHSGDEDAFYRLLGLLDEEFAELGQVTGRERERLRERLAQHFVQRRRPDLDEWKEGRIFPKRETKELTYKLTGAWQSFFDAVLDYCADVVVAEHGDERRQRFNFWGTLALLRCASSSPMAAVLALRTHAGLEANEERETLLDRLFDGDADELPEDDVEPPAGAADPVLASLLAQAEALAGHAGDPKLKLVTQHVKELLQEDFRPVVFCRYIATAHYLGRHLQRQLGHVPVGVVTGELTSTERRERVEGIGDGEGPCVLVATDCLSEGINLQDYFDAVVHYDLSWNPTRHEQREGRVDRFGQKRQVVRASMLYGVNNPVDGAVLEVILRKAAKIREELGVPVPVPDEGQSLTEVLLKAVLIRRRRGDAPVQGTQLALFESRWQNAADRTKASRRTLFAQRRLRPEDVLPEWHKSLSAIGGRKDVQRFTERALARLGSGLESASRGYKVPLAALPADVRERLAAEELTGTLRVDFDYPAAVGCQPVQRSHPLVSVLAESLLERTLSVEDPAASDDPAVLGRVGCWVSAAVTSKTTVVLLRLRHRLEIKRGQQSNTLLVEEAAAMAWTGANANIRAADEEVMDWLTAPPDTDPPRHVRQREIERVLAILVDRQSALEAFAKERAQALLEDHLRVRDASKAIGSASVRAMLPADIIGAYVLLPKVG